MCGIAGLVLKKEKFSETRSKEILCSVLKKMQHRGPDGEGMATFTAADWQFALGHRRLSIIDLATGNQPMQFEKNWITFNGEIYNYLELRSELETQGFQFDTTSDTEVLLKWLQAKGTAGIPQVDGMFSFVWWNDKEKKLVLARDRIGIKPFYYFHSEKEGLAFASELTGLLQDPRIKCKIRPESLQTFFYLGYSGTEESIIDGVKKILPGHYAVWTLEGKFSQYSYWKPEHKIQNDLTEKDWLEKLDSVLSSSVKKSLVSDVPVGLFLSGGVDSSLVAYYAKKATKIPLESFTIAFEAKTFDESEYAKMVADHLGIQHHEKLLNDEMMLQNINTALDSLDEPMADHSIIPTYFVSQFASEYKKVVVGGDGGDELFGGYDSYKATAMGDMYGKIPAWLRHGIAEPLVRNLPSSDSYQSFEWKAKRFVERWEEHPIARHLAWMGISSAEEAHAAMSSPIKKLQMQKLAETFPQSPYAPMDFDLHTFLTEYVLMKVDRASMKSSLEVRPPLLSNPVVDLAFALPMQYKVHGTETKVLLKTLAAKVLPPQTVYRKKQGFSVPLALWMRGALAPRINQILQDSPVWDAGLNRGTWKKYQGAHLAKKGNYASLLWGLLVFDHWLKRHH